MSQGNQSIANGTGAAVRSAMNVEFGALYSLSSGASAPSTTVAYMLWMDTTTNRLKQRNGSNTAWIILGSFDQTNNIFEPNVGGGVDTIASATTTDLGTKTAFALTVSGTTAITSFGTSMLPGQTKSVKFSGALTLTYNATTMQLTGQSNITTAAGDQAFVICIASGSYVVIYIPVSGQSIVSNTAASGFTNRFRNIAFDIASRGTSGSVGAGLSLYTLDGWIVTTATAACAWQQIYGTAGSDNGALGVAYGNFLQLTGATGMTSTTLKQRILGRHAAVLSGQQVTVTLFIFNSLVSGSITPTITVKRPTALNNWGATSTDVSAATLQTIPNGHGLFTSYTFAANANTVNGLEVTWDFGSSLASASSSLFIAFADIRITPGVTTGTHNSTLIPEVRPDGLEATLCGQFIASSYNNGTAPGTNTSKGIFGGMFALANTNVNGISVPFTYPLWTDPTTLTIYDRAGNSGHVSTYHNGSWTDNIALGVGAPSQSVVDSSQEGFFSYPGQNTGLNAVSFHYFASAEL